VQRAGDGVDVALADRPRKFVFDSIVAVPFASAGDSGTEEAAGGVGEAHQRAAVQHATCGAFVRAPGEPRTNLVGRRGDDLEAEKAGVRGGACTCSVTSGSASTPEAIVRAVSTELAPTPAFERSWWLRAPLVLVAPRAIFAALRDESEEAIEARQEPLLLMATLAAISVVLVSPTFRRMLNDSAVSLVLVPVLAFVAGGCTPPPLSGSGAACSTARHGDSAAKEPGAARDTCSRSQRRRSHSRCSPSGRSGSRSTARISSAPAETTTDAATASSAPYSSASCLERLAPRRRRAHGARLDVGRAAAAVGLAAAFPVLIVLAVSL